MDRNLELLLKHCDGYLSIFYKELNGIKIISDDRNGLIAGKMIRLAENFKGIVLCVAGGSPINGYILLRSMIETYILMGMNFTDVEFHKAYTDKFIRDEIKRITRQLENKYYQGTYEQGMKHIEFLKSQLYGSSRKYNMAQLFIELKKVHLYERAYVECNSHTHVDRYALNRLFNREGDNMIIGINHNHIRDSIFTLSGAIDLFNDGYRHFKGGMGIKSNSFDNFVPEADKLRKELNIKYFNAPKD
ncbi:MAG: DUF5677 domain-containing protein [Pseudobdellovibrio sp.]